jgi:hypothetical protein
MSQHCRSSESHACLKANNHWCEERSGKEKTELTFDRGNTFDLFRNMGDFHRFVPGAKRSIALGLAKLAHGVLELICFFLMTLSVLLSHELFLETMCDSRTVSQTEA